MKKNDVAELFVLTNPDTGLPLVNRGRMYIYNTKGVASAVAKRFHARGAVILRYVPDGQEQAV